MTHATLYTEIKIPCETTKMKKKIGLLPLTTESYADSNKTC